MGKYLIIGDLHLKSGDYGGHVDYANETLDVLGKCLNVAKEKQVTHVILAGDLTYNKFSTLEYRMRVELFFREINKLTSDNLYSIIGNHDKAGYGMTELEYYIEKGVIKHTSYIDEDNLKIYMIDYGKIGKFKGVEKNNKTNIAVLHDYVKFSDTKMPEYGKSIELDKNLKFLNVDLLVCGHIHDYHSFAGIIYNEESEGKRVGVTYLGSPSRPAYRGEQTDTVGHLMIIDSDTSKDEVLIDEIEIDLIPVTEAFAVEIKQIEKEKRMVKANRVDISDVLKELDSKELFNFSAEEVVNKIEGIDARYKKKALDLLKQSG